MALQQRTARIYIFLPLLLPIQRLIQTERTRKPRRRSFKQQTLLHEIRIFIRSLCNFPSLTTRITQCNIHHHLAISLRVENLSVVESLQPDDI